MARPARTPVLVMLLAAVLCLAAGQEDNPAGCAAGQPMDASDWAREGVRVSLVKTGDDASCSRYVTLEMVDEPRFHSNPYAESLAVIVNFPPGPALVVPYEVGKRAYNITLLLPQLPCDASPSCADYIGSICQQQGVGFYYQMRMRQDTGCQGGNEFLGIRDNESFNAPTWNFQPDPAAPCMPGNAAGYGNMDEGIQDLVATLAPHPTVANACRWTVNLQLAPGPKFRDSDYLDMVSFRGAGASNYGAGTRLFFKGQQLYTNTLPGAADCADTFLDVEVVVLNEFLGAYPAYRTGVSTCPFFSFKRYQFNNGQHYNLAAGAAGAASSPAPVVPPVSANYPFPTEAACTTAQPPAQMPCPSMVSVGEVVRGFGAFYDSACQVTGGSWAVYGFPGGQSCCRTCRWNRQDAVAAWLQPTELDDCPPCVKAYYEATNNGPVAIVPLAQYVSDVQCPFPKPPGGNMRLPSWIYSPQTAKCYFKSSFAKGISNNINDAIRRCTEVHGGRLLKISSQAEDEFIRLNLLWTGFFGETYTGLRKPGRLDPNFVNAWFWADNTTLQPTDYQRWAPAPRDHDYAEDVDLCMEFLPQQPKSWNPFGCGVNKHYICERPATNGVPVAPLPPNAPPADCSSMPAMPAGVVAPVALINAGGLALCNYFAADGDDAPLASAGGAEDWVGQDPACLMQRAACSVRFGGTFSYTINTRATRTYLLRFTFSEVFWAAAGQRLFDVLVNGATVLAGIDPYALAGARFTPVMREVTVTAAGPSMLVTLQARADNAVLAALEVFEMDAAAAAAAPAQPSPSPEPATPAQPPVVVVVPEPSSPEPVVETPEPSPEPEASPEPEPSPEPEANPELPISPSPVPVADSAVEASPSPAATQPDGSADDSPTTPVLLVQTGSGSGAAPTPASTVSGAVSALAKPAAALLIALLAVVLL